MARPIDTVNVASYSYKMTTKERQRMFEVLKGEDAIDSSKVKSVVHKTVKTNDTNFFAPEKWNY